MKKLTLSVLTVLLLSGFAPAKVNAVTEPDTISVVMNKPDGSAKSEALLTRLDEIKAMDKSGLTSSEKRKLRKETRLIKKTLTLNNGGVYLSAGAIIIIIILLIVLL